MCHRYHYFSQNSPVALGVALGADRRKRHWNYAPQAPCQSQAPCQPAPSSALGAAGSRPQGGVSQPLARGSGVGTPFWRLNAQRERPPMLRLERQQNPKGRGPSAKGTHATYFSKTPRGIAKGDPQTVDCRTGRGVCSNCRDRLSLGPVAFQRKCQTPWLAAFWRKALCCRSAVKSG